MMLVVEYQDAIVTLAFMISTYPEAVPIYSAFLIVEPHRIS
jgi:hypothetical protein